MTRLLLAGAALLLAGAGPFDTYQLIMWQDHDPAALEGLKGLGFTGVKLRATGGQIDPAERDRYRQAGLPYFLENIATDFYAPYHRYQPGKPVTYLFQQAQARRQADPKDASVFIREPSLSDPDWIARVETRLSTLARSEAPIRPLFYNLADESGIADLSAAWDFDVAAPALAAFRTWLQSQYPGLPALNAQWGTRYERWADIRPELTDAALARADQNYSAWGDFKAWMDQAFAAAVARGAAALHRADPQALAALEGGQVPGWGGYAYGDLAPALDLMEIYDTGDAVALARAANPDLIILRTSFGSGDGFEAWRNLLQGGRGTIVWDEDDGVVGPDGTPKPRGLELARLAEAIRRVAPALYAAHPAPDGVAVLVSQQSFRLQWLLDRRPGGPIWAERGSARENEDNAWRAARREMLQRLFGLGLTPRLLTGAFTDAAALQRDGVRVLLLPHAIALADSEIDAIRAFVAAGGAVFADTEPGLFDGHGKRRDAPPLAGLVSVPEALYRIGDRPSPAALDATAGLLGGVGIVPRATLRTPDGARAAGLEARWFTAGTGAILSLQPIAPGAAPQAIELDLPAPAQITDLRRGTAPERLQRVPLTIDSAEPTILSLEP